MARETSSFMNEDLPLLKVENDCPPLRRNIAKSQTDLRDGPSVPIETGFLSDDTLPSARNRNMERQRMALTPSDRFSSSRKYGTTLTQKHDDEKSLIASGKANSAIFEVEGDVGRAKRRGIKDRLKKVWSISRIASLTVVVIISMILFSINHEIREDYLMASLSKDNPYSYNISSNVTEGKWTAVTLRIRGPFEDYSYNDYSNTTSNIAMNSNFTTRNCSHFVAICAGDIQMEQEDMTACKLLTQNYTKKKCVSVEITRNQWLIEHPEHLGEEAGIERTIHVSDGEGQFILSFVMDAERSINFEFSMVGEILGETGQILLSGLVLLVVYILIIFDLVHRTMAAIIGSTATLAILSMLNKRPTLNTVVDWISLETICLLFGMMTMVAVFSQTGFFDYFAVKIYKLARGRVWPLISLLCIFSAFVSAFLDNVTTILLLTPVSIRLCQVLNLDPKPVLIAEVVFSNIGGTATAIGDPPNVIIVSHPVIKREGIDFAEFTLHLFIGIIFCTVIAYGILYVFYKCINVGKKSEDPPHIAELKREIAIWRRTARYLPVVSLEERAVRDALRAKAQEVTGQLREAQTVSQRSMLEIWEKNLLDLEEQYTITDRPLLIKSFCVLTVTIILFFSSNFIPNVELELGWIALFGAITLLLLSDIQELETILNKIEWGTLLFFAALFVLMEGLAELGLIDFIGNTTVDIIKAVESEYQLLVAIVLIVWVSAIASSFIDNIPFTQATIPVIAKLAESPDVCLGLRPLVWSLAFGACLGGNGTLIGASANVVCAGLAEQNGYKITFKGFFKIGFPMMLVTAATACVYLIICHVAIGWDVTGDEC